MPTADKPRFTIIGAGLGGALLANYLGRSGHTVDVYERRPDPATGNVPAGRSINLAISARGLHALDEVGLLDRALRQVVPMRGRMIHAPNGDLTFQPYSKNPDDAINSISRAGLNKLLLDTARQHDNVRVHFDHRCIDVDPDKPSAVLERSNGAGPVTTQGDILVGADGAFSSVRQAMQRLDRFNFSQDYLEHGYKELTMPPAPGGGFAMEPHALHIWPRRAFMMIALPNADASYTCTLFWPFQGPVSFDALRDDDQVRAFFEQHFPDVIPLMPDLAKNYRRNPVGSLVTTRCQPYHYADKVVVLGDAAHAVVPFYGQGMNAAFEDCTVLNQCIQQYAPDFSKILARYTDLRRVNCNALADLAISNFLEMRDRTGSATFRRKKKLEQTLHKILGRRFVPLYSMISFGRLPYAQAIDLAQRRGRRLVRWIGAVGALLLLVLAIIVLG